MLILRLGARVLSLILVSGAGLVYSQGYPNKPIRIVTSAAGGGADFTARLISLGISGPLGQQVIVDNRTGLIAADIVSKAPPDGYTLIIHGASLWIFPLLQPAPYDAVNDFAPITLVSMEPSVLVVQPSVATSVKELIAVAKARPGALNYASSGIASAPHLATELFKSMAGVNILHIPYKGAGPSVIAILAGEVQLRIGSLTPMLPHIKSGKLRALGVTSLKSTALVPDLPPIAVSLPGYEAVGITGLMGPAKIPTAIINRLNQEIVRMLNRAEVKEKLLAEGQEGVGESPKEFAGTIKADLARWSRVIKDAGIKGE